MRQPTQLRSIGLSAFFLPVLLLLFCQFQRRHALSFPGNPFPHHPPSPSAGGPTFSDHEIMNTVKEYRARFQDEEPSVASQEEFDRKMLAMAQDWDQRLNTLREETRQSRRELEQRVQSQSQVIQRLQELVRRLSEKENCQPREPNQRQKDCLLSTENSQNLTEQSGERHSRSDDLHGWEPLVDQLSNRVETLTSDLQALKNWADLTRENSGSIYTRWGGKACPGEAQLLYSGFVGGSFFDSPGAAANYLCLPQNPVFDGHQIPPAINKHNHVQVLYGGEYQASNEGEHDKLPACAVCHSPGVSSTVMVPATNVCPAGWNQEYHGYLMAGATTHAGASEFVCVDSSEEYIAGTERNEDGKLFYYTVTHCGSLPCPSYVNNQIVTCVVCSK